MRRAFAAFVLLVAAVRVSAAPPERTHDITPADYASVNTITEISLSPDGKQVAYCLATWDKKSDKRATELWVVDTDGKGKPKQLTNDRANDSHPKWSADGKAIYVLATRGEKGKAKQQVWKVPLDGKPEQVTKISGGVAGFDYAPKADTVFYTADATATEDGDFAELRKKYGKIDYGHGKRTVSELFAVSDGGKEIKKLVANQRYIREFAVTRDGKKIAMVTAYDDSVVKSEGESRVDVWEGGKVVTPPTDVYRAKAASPYAWLESLAWNPDGTRFAFCAIFDAYPTEVIIGELKGGEWTTDRIDRGNLQVRGYGSPLSWQSPDVIGYIAETGFVNNFSAVIIAANLSSGVRRMTGHTGAIYGFGWLPTEPGSDLTPIAAILGTPASFADVRILGSKEKTPPTLTDVNAHTKAWKCPSIRHIFWKAPDGTQVGGPLELPYGWKEGDKPLPLVVAIHGGPTTASYNDLRFDPHNGRLYFAAAGYAVLCPNYRGSTGYGDKFVTDLIGNENDLDVKDIVSGIQHLIKEGIADPERIAVMGWSNGGYLTNCLITLKDPPVKIKAASSGAGIVDTVAEWGFNDEPAYPIVFKKGLPWEKPENYRKTSPTYGLGNVTTPTLIHVGGSDPRCPPGHSRMLYRALKEYRKVPTQLCEYPGQPHGLGTLSFRTAKMEWDLAWFEKYLKK
jgi:dipeptidyl aminopeptidase/acylaminoacyl peptidase